MSAMTTELAVKSEMDRAADVLKMRLPDIRDGFLWLTQGKTRKKLRMAIAGELAVLIERIQNRTYKVTSLALIRNETGQALSYSALDNRFEEARKRAAKVLDDVGETEAAAEVKRFQWSNDYYNVHVAAAPDPDLPGPEPEALTRHALQLFQDYVHLNRRIPDEVVPTTTAITLPAASTRIDTLDPSLISFSPSLPVSSSLSSPAQTVTFTLSSLGSTITLAGLMSRCTTPWLCA